MSGFGLYTHAGEWIPAIFRADVDPSDGSTILLHVNGKIPKMPYSITAMDATRLWNLWDHADMGPRCSDPSLYPLKGPQIRVLP